MKSIFKTVTVKFANLEYNYKTSVNGRLTDEEIKRYWIGQPFNLGHISDNVQICIDIEISEAWILEN